MTSTTISTADRKTMNLAAAGGQRARPAIRYSTTIGSEFEDAEDAQQAQHTHVDERVPARGTSSAR
jgi:hypothetical protein